MSGLFVSVIVPTYNRVTKLHKCLDAILGQNYPKFELIVSNDRSTDNTENLLKKYAEKYENFSFVMSECKGPSGARNSAIMKARGDVILMIDDDCVAFPDWISKHLKYYEKEEVVATGGPQMPDHSNVVDDYLVARYIEQNTGYFEIKGTETNKRLPSCNAGFRKKIFDEIGLFDESFAISSGEDSEFCLRILEKGYTMISDSDLTVKHLKVMNVKSFVKMLFSRCYGMVIECFKHDSFPKYFFSPFVDFQYFRNNLKRYRQYKGNVGFIEKMQVHGLSFLRHYVTLFGNYYYYFALKKQFKKRDK